MCYLRCLRWRASGKKLGETVGAISGADRLSVLCSVHTAPGGRADDCGIILDR